MLGPHPNPFTTIATRVSQDQYKVCLVRCPLVYTSRVPPKKPESHLQYSSHTTRRHQLGARGHMGDEGTGVQTLSTGGRLGYSKSSPLFSSSEKEYYNGSFSETAIVSSNTDICFYSEYFFTKCHELSHSEKRSFC